jgi:Arc/MetJ family transcription regulator
MKRTTVALDDALVRKARKLTGIKTTQELLNHALQELVRLRKQREILNLRGRIHWEGDLDSLRASRQFE